MRSKQSRCRGMVEPNRIGITGLQHLPPERSHTANESCGVAQKKPKKKKEFDGGPEDGECSKKRVMRTARQGHECCSGALDSSDVSVA